MRAFPHPAIFLFDDMVIPTDEDWEKHWQIDWLDDDTFQTVESVRPEANFQWVIDSDAKIHDISILTKKHEWSRPLRYLWRFVKVIYRVGPAMSLTIGDLLFQLQETREDWDKSLTPALRNFLSTKNSESQFTQALMLEFLASPERFEDEIETTKED
ncbi:hypothetical protein [Cerasicoccus frondis]|uniref:hypothetical protein n=1 Tax=Cerasicoccus frondis TaxID=490090 RepID=UPI002852C2B0|nr:hypothetical protein [Cerasicoccus frondis]